MTKTNMTQEEMNDMAMLLCIALKGPMPSLKKLR